MRDFLTTLVENFSIFMGVLASLAALIIVTMSVALWELPPYTWRDVLTAVRGAVAFSLFFSAVFTVLERA